VQNLENPADPAHRFNTFSATSCDSRSSEASFSLMGSVRPMEQVRRDPDKCNFLAEAAHAPVPHRDLGF